MTTTNELAGSQGVQAGDARSALEDAIRTSEGGSTPEQWPARYEPVITAAIEALEPGEQVMAAWRMRTTGPRERVGDVGLVVVTDRRVLGSDHSPKGDGMFQIPADQISEVYVSPHVVGKVTIGEEIVLLGAEHQQLGSGECPTKFQVFATGQDPSRFKVRVRQREELVSVQESMVKLLPAARATTGSAIAVDHGATVVPRSGVHASVAAVAPLAGTAAAPAAGSRRVPTGINAPTSRFRPILYLMVGIGDLLMVALAVVWVFTSSCTREGWSYVCVDSGNGVQLNTTINIPLIIGALFLGPFLIWVGIRGIRQANALRKDL